MRQIATRSGNTVSMPITPGGNASVPDSTAARAAAFRASLCAAARGSATACSRLGGTAPTISSIASTTEPTIGCRGQDSAAIARSAMFPSSVYGLQSRAEGGGMSQIKTYAILPPVYVEYDPLAPAVAARVGTLIEAAAPWARVEHIGSTAIPGCAGKGIVDLVVLYPRGKLEATRAAIDGLGFQPQRTGHEFPDERPMRVGAIDFAES